MRRSALALLLCSAALALSGCRGNCRALSEKLCECFERPTERELCLRNAASEEQRVEPTAEQEAVCGELLPQCDCHTIDTDAGKRACGLAY